MATAVDIMVAGMAEVDMPTAAEGIMAVEVIMAVGVITAVEGDTTDSRWP